MAEKESSQSSSGDSPPTTFCRNTTYVSSRAKELAPELCLPSNPFAIKANNSNDATDDGTKPLIAPSMLKLNDTDSSAGQITQSSSASKVVLRPSRLAAQAERLEHHASPEKNSKKEDENSEKQTIVKDNPFLENNNTSTPQIFVPKISTSTVNVFSVSKETKTSPNKSEDSNVGFIFGQNLHERALNYDAAPSAVSFTKTHHDLTFEDAAQKCEESKETDNESTQKSLSESAKEYESKQAKRKYDEVSVITGEEGESNALQINCKLFEFNTSEKSWQERGKGNLRLNDQMNDGVLHSRVVMRTQGNLRLVLNTKVWPGMTVQHPSEKKVQLSAAHSDGVRVYLVVARPKDADQLYSALEWRVSALKSKSEASNDSNSANNGENNVSSPDIAAVTENHNLNGNISKKLRLDTDESVDSVEKSDSGEGDISSDSTKENYAYTTC